MYEDWRNWCKWFYWKIIGKVLINEGFSVTKFTSDSNLKDMTYVNWEDKKQLKSNFGNLDVLIHLSWVGIERQLRYIEDVQQINVRRTKTLVSVLNNTSISQIIAFGSQDELKDGSQPWSDDSPFLPISEYGKAKFESFNLLKNHSNSFT
jgi:hypothetical protein